MSDIVKQRIGSNLEAVRVGAMVHENGMDDVLLRAKLIRRNKKGWYDLTPAGRAMLQEDDYAEGASLHVGLHPELYGPNNMPMADRT